MSKTVLITGTSSGIGKASAALFASKGWNVVATLRRPEKSTLEPSDRLLVTRLDVEDRDSIAEAIAAGITRFGKIDALVNNAGFGQYGIFEAIGREQVQQQFDVNVFGVMDVTRAILPHFRANKAGMVVNVSSGAGIFTLPMISLYCASKFALEGWSEALSYELLSQNIGVKLVLPHGGVSETQFSERQADRRASGETPTDYAAFVARTNAHFADMGAARSMTSGDVAQAIYGATTDGADTLRYYVGDDERGIVKARYELSEADYIKFMREKFLAA